MSFGSTAQQFSSPDGSIFGSGSFGEGLFSSNITASYINAILLNDTTICATFSGDTYVALALLTYNSSTGLWDVAKTHNLNANVQLNKYIQMEKYDDTHILITYNWSSSNNGKISLIEVDTVSETFTEVSGYVFKYATIDNLSVAKIGDYITVTYVDTSLSTNAGQYKILELSALYAFSEYDSGYFDTGTSDIEATKIIGIDNTRALLMYVDNDDYLSLRVLENTSGVFTMSSKTQVVTTDDSSVTKLTKLDTNKFIVTYSDTTLQYKVIDVNDIQVTTSSSHDLEISVDYISSTLGYSADSISDVYWFMSVYSESNTLQSKTFMVEGQQIYDGLTDSLAYDYTFPLILMNSDNIGFVSYRNEADTYGYYRTLTGVGLTSYGSSRLFYWETNETILLVNFDGDLEGGNVSGGVYQWRLKRKEADTDLYTTIGTFSLSTTSYIDNIIKNNTTYIYLLFALDVNGNESNAITNTGSVNFTGWMIADENEWYNIDIGFGGTYKTSNINTNKAYHEYKNLTKYPSVSFGNQNYRSGNITCAVYSYNYTYTDYNMDLETLANFTAFIDNGLEKYLKTQDGDIIKVVTKNAQYKYQDELVQQPSEISFDFCEVGEVE